MSWKKSCGGRITFSVQNLRKKTLYFADSRWCCGGQTFTLNVPPMHGAQSPNFMKSAGFVERDDFLSSLICNPSLCGSATAPMQIWTFHPSRQAVGCTTLPMAETPLVFRGNLQCHNPGQKVLTSSSCMHIWWKRSTDDLKHLIRMRSRKVLLHPFWFRSLESIRKKQPLLAWERLQGHNLVADHRLQREWLPTLLTNISSEKNTLFPRSSFCRFPLLTEYTRHQRVRHLPSMATGTKTLFTTACSQWKDFTSLICTGTGLFP